MKKRIQVFIVLMCMLFSGCSFSLSGGDDKSENLEQITKNDNQNPNDSSSKENNNHNVVENKDVYKPSLLKEEESDDILATDDKFSTFFNNIKDKSDDIESFVEGYNESKLVGLLDIARNNSNDGYVEYTFSLDNEEIFTIKNEIENIGQAAEYIQIKDINEDGNDEILIAYFTRGTSTFLVNEFYIYGLYENSWNQVMSYIYANNDSNIASLMNDNGYSDADITDVSLSDQGLIISVDKGEKIDGVYYPKGNKLYIKLE